MAALAANRVEYATGMADPRRGACQWRHGTVALADSTRYLSANEPSQWEPK